MLENEINVQHDFAKEEKISKLKALRLFDTNKTSNSEVGTFEGLSKIHQFLFEDIYSFAGKIRKENIAKNNFRFASCMYLEEVLKKIDDMPQKKL